MPNRSLTQLLGTALAAVVLLSLVGLARAQNGPPEPRDRKAAQRIAEWLDGIIAGHRFQSARRAGGREWTPGGS